MTAASKETIESWVSKGKKDGAEFVMIVADTFDWEDFPVYINNEVELDDKLKEFGNPNTMFKIMEIYSMEMDLNKQLSEGRAWHTNHQ